jgi:hypothetical protein
MDLAGDSEIRETGVEKFVPRATRRNFNAQKFSTV